MNIWKALDAYLEKYALPESAWHAMGITVDRKTNRDVFYFLGSRPAVDAIRTYVLEDNSCDFVKAIKTHMKELELVFILSNRNGVVDVYKSNGLLSEKKMPHRIHMNEFIILIAALTGSTVEVPKAIPFEGMKIDGAPVAMGRDSGIQQEEISEEWSKAKGMDFTESTTSAKYSPAKVRAQAAAAAGLEVNARKTKALERKEQEKNEGIKGMLNNLFGKKDK